MRSANVDGHNATIREKPSHIRLRFRGAREHGERPAIAHPQVVDRDEPVRPGVAARGRQWAVVALIAAMPYAVAAAAQEQPSAGRALSTDANTVGLDRVEPSLSDGIARDDSANGEHAVDDPEAERRQKLASIMLMALGGVLIVGVAMIAGTMIWGSKLRRLARGPEAASTRRDELWYLKKPQQDSPPLERAPGELEEPPSRADAEGDPSP